MSLLKQSNTVFFGYGRLFFLKRKASDWNHFIRPNLWAFGLAIYFIGVLASGFYLPAHLVGAIVAILLCTSSITVNHYFDVETDRKSKQLYRFPVAAGKISKRSAAVFSLAVVLVSIFLGFFLNTNSLIWILFANFMVFTYSVPPIRIKERPYLETFWNGMGYGWVPFYLGLLISGIQINYFQHLLGFIPFLISASGHILLQVRDIEDDKKGNVTTTSTKLGLKKMKRVSQGMIGIAGLVIIYLAAVGFLNPLAWLSVVFGALVFAEHKRMKNDVEKSYRKLQILYILGGILFILSIFKF